MSEQEGGLRLAISAILRQARAWRCDSQMTSHCCRANTNGRWLSAKYCPVSDGFEPRSDNPTNSEPT